MASKYDEYWLKRMEPILDLFERARHNDHTASLDVSGLKDLGERDVWAGRLFFENGAVVVEDHAHLTALGKLLTPRLPEWARVGEWQVRLDRQFNLNVKQILIDSSDQMSRLIENKLAEAIEIVRRRFPGWNSFDNPRFVKSEVAYKQETVAKAQELLGKAQLEQLTSASQYDEILERIRKVAMTRL